MFYIYAHHFYVKPYTILLYFWLLESLSKVVRWPKVTVVYIYVIWFLVDNCPIGNHTTFTFLYRYRIICTVFRWSCKRITWTPQITCIFMNRADLTLLIKIYTRCIIYQLHKLLASLILNIFHFLLTYKGTEPKHRCTDSEPFFSNHLHIIRTIWLDKFVRILQ